MKPMNLIALVMTAATCGLLSNCAAPERPVTQSELAAQLRQLPAGSRLISLSADLTTPGGKSSKRPELVMRPGEETSYVNLREGIFPLIYESPALTGSKVSPATPTKFTHFNVGSSITLTPEIRGQLVVFRGKAEITEFNRFIPMGGELGRPITDDGGKLITENKVEMPALRTYTTPIFVAVKSGVPTSVEIDGPVKGNRLTLTAKLVDSSGRALQPTKKER